ncbi:hypothetical protein PENTCL1PPCAC_7575, partial [Pristionchus entomophagus]
RMLSRLAPKAAVRSAISGTNASRFASAAATGKKEKPAPMAAQESDSFCMNLFRGKAKVDQVFPYPLNLDEERKETLQMILDPTAKFLNEVNDVVKNDENAETPMAVLKQFAELGAFGALVPPEYEGAGMNNTQMARLAEIVGSHDLGLGVIMGAHQSIGYKGILLVGTEEQKKKYLPDLATGRKFAAFCLTEPSTGSDANSVRSTARKSDDGSHYILNANKIYISNGGFADVFTVFAQMPIKQADGTTKNKVTAFIVERGFGGITNGPPEKKMGIKGSNTAVVDFENVKIPKENLLGGEGEGFKVAMNILNNGRFGIPAAMTGAMKHCIKKTIDHVTTREQFGHKLEEYGNVQEKLANMIAKQYACESILYILASNMDRGIQDYQLEAAIAKVFTSECAWFTCDEAIQVHGGMGFMKETGLERVLRDLRIFRIFEGANDIMRIFVGLTGIQHAGKHLQAQASGGIGGLIGLAMGRFAGPSGAFNGVVDPALKKSADALDNCVSLFGRTVQDLLVKHKKGIINRQYEVVRVADAAIDIYGMAATLSRCTQTSKSAGSTAEYEKKVANYFCETAAARAEANLKSVAADNEAIVNTIAEISKGACSAGANPIAHPIDTL